MSFPDSPKPRAKKSGVRENFDLLDLPDPMRPLKRVQAEARELLGRLAVHLFAEAAGNTALGLRIGVHAARPVSQQLMSHWLAGRYPMQPWAIRALAQVFREARTDLQDRLIRQDEDMHRVISMIASLDMNLDGDAS